MHLSTLRLARASLFVLTVAIAQPSIAETRQRSEQGSEADVVALAEADAADDATSDKPSLPVRAADRPPVLPRHALRIDSSLNLARNGAAQGFELDGVLGGGFGITDKLEVGGQFVPVTLAPHTRFESPLFYASYVVVGGNWTVVPTLQFSVPVRSEESWSLDGVVVVSGVVDQVVILTISPAVSVVFADQAVVTVALPFQAAWQISERILIGAQSGVGFAYFDPRTNTARAQEVPTTNDLSIPLGFSAIATLGVDDGPFVDIGLLYQWPALLQVDTQEDVFNPGDWDLLLSASSYFSL